MIIFLQFFSIEMFIISWCSESHVLYQIMAVKLELIFPNIFQ